MRMRMEMGVGTRIGIRVTSVNNMGSSSRRMMGMRMLEMMRMMGMGLLLWWMDGIVRMGMGMAVVDDYGGLRCLSMVHFRRRMKLVVVGFLWGLSRYRHREGRQRGLAYR